MVAYYGFILLVAFDKPLLAQKIGSGVTTLGMPIGVAVIVFTIIITWIYIRRANSEFDSLTEQIVKGVVKRVSTSSPSGCWPRCWLCEW